MAALGSVPTAGRAQEVGEPAACATGRITNIFVDNRSIFAVEEAPPGLRWLYGLANRLHVTTREGFILRELLFREGDCVDPVLLEESGRILRQYPFIGTADVFAVQQPEGDYHIVVDTQDEWTTRVDLGVSFDGGLQFEKINVTEENVAGQGVLAAAFFRRRRERRDAGFRLAQPRLFGTRTDASFDIGSTRVGSSLDQELAYPFVGEIGRFAVRQTYHRRDENFTYSAGTESPDFSHALLPFEEEWLDVSVAGRIGAPGNLTLFGLGLSRERVSFPTFPGGLEVAIASDFGSTVAAPTSVQNVISSQTRARSATRVNFLVGQRNLHFTRARGLDALDGEWDIQLGTDIGLVIGRTVDALTVSSLDSEEDIYGRARFFGGAAPGSSFIFTNFAVEGRRLISGQSGWRDVIGDADIFAYVRAEALGSHTIFARASAAGGWSMVAPFQLTLGGREGVRGFTEDESPGARKVILSVEDRIFLNWPFPESMDFGLTVFADAGRMWAGDIPYGVDTEWRGTVGFGLRFGLPARSRGVGRIDIALPIGGRIDQGPIFRVTLLELLGVSGGFAEDQVQRSRRGRVGPDYFVVER